MSVILKAEFQSRAKHHFPAQKAGSCRFSISVWLILPVSICHPQGAPCRASQRLRDAGMCLSPPAQPRGFTRRAVFRAAAPVQRFRLLPWPMDLIAKGRKKENFFKSSQPQLRDSPSNYQTEFSRVEIPALISPSPGRRGMQSSGWRCACWMPCAPSCSALAAVTDLRCYTSLMSKKKKAHLTKLSCKRFAPKRQAFRVSGKRL